MARYHLKVLVAFYFLRTFLLLLLILDIFHVSPLGIACITTGWVVYCLIAAFTRTSYELFFKLNTREPIRVEEEELKKCFLDVLRRAEEQRRYRMLISEDTEMNAFAFGRKTIILSRGLLGQLTNEQLKAVMAHELGHLRSGDGMTAIAFYIAGQLPNLFKSLKKRARLGFFLSNAIFLLLGLLLQGDHGIWKILGVLLLLRIDPFFRLCFKSIFREFEFKQDAFACKLGFGEGLRQMLCILASQGPQKVNKYWIWRNSMHPVIFERIRRLEAMEDQGYAVVLG